MAVWRSGNDVWYMKLLCVRPSKYWDGLPSLNGHTTLLCNQRPRSTHPHAFSGTGNEYQPKFGDDMWLRSRGRMAHSICGCMCRCV